MANLSRLHWDTIHLPNVFSQALNENLSSIHPLYICSIRNYLSYINKEWNDSIHDNNLIIHIALADYDAFMLNRSINKFNLFLQFFFLIHILHIISFSISPYIHLMRVFAGHVCSTSLEIFFTLHAQCSSNISSSRNRTLCYHFTDRCPDYRGPTEQTALSTLRHWWQLSLGEHIRIFFSPFTDFSLWQVDSR